VRKLIQKLLSSLDSFFSSKAPVEEWFILEFLFGHRRVYDYHDPNDVREAKQVFLEDWIGNENKGWNYLRSFRALEDFDRLMKENMSRLTGEK